MSVLSLTFFDFGGFMRRRCEICCRLFDRGEKWRTLLESFCCDSCIEVHKLEVHKLSERITVFPDDFSTGEDYEYTL